MDRVINCPICGKAFTAKKANAKYCGIECAKKGKYLSRKEWEKRTGFLEKQRQTMREYREKITTAEQEERKKAEKKAATNRKRQETRKRNIERGLLLQAAEQGDNLARMELEEIDSPEYWEAWRDYQKEYAASFDLEAAGSVNGININDPEFDLKVSISIEETGKIEIKSDFVKRITDDEGNIL